MQLSDFASLSDLEVIWSDHGGICPIPTRTLVASDLLLSVGPLPDREFDQSFQRISGALVLAYGDPLYDGGLQVINDAAEAKSSASSVAFSSKQQGHFNTVSHEAFYNNENALYVPFRNVGEVHPEEDIISLFGDYSPGIFLRYVVSERTSAFPDMFARLAERATGLQVCSKDRSLLFSSLSELRRKLPRDLILVDGSGFGSHPSKRPQKTPLYTTNWISRDLIEPSELHHTESDVPSLFDLRRRFSLSS
ncbi:hypothetical protein PsAD2_04023 [Pseudovibrio axinellae]|uniref:Uncharacterized protein n=1 Tax=Pseudovibrio axinellae TaxID=989403 RepID=A0A165U199_9HYPH|nr:hypothetical protein [Pseudovibrio axinellae]KZL09423.1 hypothetical protein PsAD2_04023 [Pseudovibrio axinellae]SEQ65342.1 hypothetical protein SAMN05421798_103352 [Pseudovibrio axinellae]